MAVSLVRDGSLSTEGRAEYEAPAATYLVHLRPRQLSYLFTGRDRIDLPMVLEELATRFQIKTLILEC
jgi:hypothetical protein